MKNHQNNQIPIQDIPKTSFHLPNDEFVAQQMQLENNSQQSFHPVVYGTQLNQVGSLELSNNTHKEPMLTQNLQPIQDQPFFVQKIHILKIIIVLILGSIIEYIQIFGLSWIFNDSDSYGVLFFPSLITLIIMGKIASIHTMRKPLISVILFIILSFLTSLTLTTLGGLFNNQNDSDTDGSNPTSSNIVMMIVILQILINLVVKIIILIYIFFETQRIKSTCLLLFIGILCSMMVFISMQTFLNAALTIIYSILLLSSLNQIIKGRFNLLTCQIFGNANATYFGILFPCILD